MFTHTLPERSPWNVSAALAGGGGRTVSTGVRSRAELQVSNTLGVLLSVSDIINRRACKAILPSSPINQLIRRDARAEIVPCLTASDVKFDYAPQDDWVRGWVSWFSSKQRSQFRARRFLGDKKWEETWKKKKCREWKQDAWIKNLGVDLDWLEKLPLFLSDQSGRTVTFLRTWSKFSWVRPGLSTLIFFFVFRSISWL